jgi:hypothetical protein
MNFKLRFIVHLKGKINHLGLNCNYHFDRKSFKNEISVSNFLSAFTLFQFSFTLKREKSDKNLEEEKRRILGGGFETAMVGNWGKA